MFGETTTEMLFSVPIIDDNIDEALEQFEARLELAASETQTGRDITVTTAPAFVTITDNDTPPTGITLSLSPASVIEGSSGSTTMTAVTVTASYSGGTAGVVLTAATRLTVSVASGGSSPATAGGTDFATVRDFTVTIDRLATSGSGTFNLVVTGDTLVEGDETLTVTGTADLSVTGATLTITDDDTDVVLSLIPTSVAEGATMPVAVAVTATLSGFLPADEYHDHGLGGTRHGDWRERTSPRSLLSRSPSWGTPPPARPAST